MGAGREGPCPPSRSISHTQLPRFSWAYGHLLAFRPHIRLAGRHPPPRRGSDSSAAREEGCSPPARTRETPSDTWMSGYGAPHSASPDIAPKPVPRLWDGVTYLTARAAAGPISPSRDL